MFYKFHNIRIKKKGAGNETFIYKSFENFRGGVKSDPPKQGTEHGNPKHKPKNLIHDHNGWIRTVTLLVVFALIWGQVPVAGSVTDNMPSVIQRILGIREDTVADSFEGASTNAKINYMEKQMVALQSSVEQIKGQNSAYSLYCFIQSADTRYEGCELTLTSGSGNQVATGNLHLDKKLNKYVANIYSNFNGNCTLQYGSVKESINLGATGQEHQLKPYISDLTVWIDSNNSAYAGRSVVLKDSGGGTVQSAELKLVGGHYEATMTAYANGNYTIAYPYVASSKILNLTTGVTLNGSAKRQQLFGDLQQMTIADIQACCKAGAITSIAKVGDTFSDGTYTYTIIGINQDKPSDASGNLLNSNQYGDVLTVMPLGAPKGASNGQPVTMNASATPWGVNYAPMNSNGSNSGSWAASQMRSTTMPQYLAKLPRTTQNAIGYVQKVTGTWDGSTSGGNNSVTGDKCFLLSGKEIFGGSGGSNGSHCTANEANATFQYQYFQNIATTPASRNINSSANQWWWLRSPHYNNSNYFCYVSTGSSHASGAYYGGGVFAAFCIY